MLKSRFNAIVWTFNGVVLALVCCIALIEGASLLWSELSLWFEPRHERGVIVGTAAELADELNTELQHVTFSHPRRIGKTDYYLTPVIIFDKKMPEEIKEALATANDISYSMIGANINMLFFNVDRTDVRKLLPRNGYVASFDLPRSYIKEDEQLQDVLVYRIATEDTNGDNRINNEDHLAYYISDLQGNALQKVTPDSISPNDHWFSPNYREIYFEVVTEDETQKVYGYDYFLKSRTLYYYNLDTKTFGRFDKLDRVFEDIEQEYKQASL